MSLAREPSRQTAQLPPLVKRHTQHALDRSLDAETRYHLRQALQFVIE
jgi:hypothetical protein